MGAVMDGEATPAQLAALLMGLRMRGETVDELAGLRGRDARAGRRASRRRTATIDVVGTGGDGSGTFNISTTAALVVAAGGRARWRSTATGRSPRRPGSADVLDALGVRIDHDAASAGAALRDIGFAFLFAPGFHPAMKHAGPTRREIGVRTAFNLLGPLTNPAGTTRQLLGVGDARRRRRASPRSPSGSGTERTFVIHGAGIDELPLDDSGVLYHVGPDGIERHDDPGVAGSGCGLTRDRASSPAARRTRTPGRSSRCCRGEPGAKRDVVLLNAGAALPGRRRGRRPRGAGSSAPALTIDAGLGHRAARATSGRASGAEAAAVARASATLA